jgi:hypothetical protein
MRTNAMTTIMGTLKFVGKASLQILKTTVSLAAGTVATVSTFLAFVVLPTLISRSPVLLVRFVGRFVVRSLLLAVFAGVFYLTFKLLEPRVAARKKLLVATLGIVFPLAWFSWLNYARTTPTLGITEFLQWRSPPSPAKPYGEAIYDVYSDLVIGEVANCSLWNKLIDPIPEGVLIRIDTTTATGPGKGPGFEPASLLGNTMPQKQFDPALSSAMADYTRRNKESFQLERRFNLPKYDLITTAEEKAVLNDEGHDQEGSGCVEFVRKHPDYYRWVELSAVGFNEDQTAAYVYMVEWRGSSLLCRNGIFGHGGPRILHKRNGKWYLVETGVFADWVTYAVPLKNTRDSVFAGE